MGGQGGIAENVFLIDVVLVVVHGAIPHPIGDVIAQGAHPPLLPSGEDRIVTAKKDASPKPEVFVKGRQHPLGEVVALSGNVQGKSQRRLLPALWEFIHGSPSFSLQNDRFTALFCGMFHSLTALYTFCTRNSMLSPTKISEKIVHFFRLCLDKTAFRCII